MNILIVDHSKVFKAVWDRMILELGHQPVTVSDAEHALEIIRERRIDIVLASLSLPGMDGIDLCREIRRHPQNNNVPFVLLTSNADQQLREQAFEAGVTEIQSKTDVNETYRRLKKSLEELKRPVTGRILYIEDSQVVAHVMMKILIQMNLEVDHFKSAEEAFEAFQHVNYDLIISDIVVQGSMSGVGLVNRIRELPTDKARVPILAVSGMDDTARRIELFRLGVNDFISKPAIEEEVVARVTNLITNKQLFDQVKAQQQHLYELAMIDQLTGLYNRNFFNEFAPKYLSEAVRHDFELSLLMIDIDHFKRINDTRGHLAGDMVLAAIGELLRAHSREEDFAARYGGEEFVLMLRHCALEDACRRAEQLRAEVAALNPEGISLTVSIGCTARPHGREVTLEELFKLADGAVYDAKNAGRNCVVRQQLVAPEPA